ncbi:MAG: FtsX-like permease family protein [Paludibacteraceae bacterium]|nr:FtsX-like permease family protein [Paludibacteraceae bacterium]
MRIELQIAWRYLWGKKSHNAINIVSGVSAAAVMVVTAAMVCIMSVMNGFGCVIEDMFSQFDPDLKIHAVQGTSFATDTPEWDAVRNLSCVEVFAPTIEETALVEYNSQQIPAQLKGVDNSFSQLTHIDSILIDGKFAVQEGDFNYTVMGVGLSGQLNIGAHFVHPLHLYAPKREGRVNMLRPEDSFNRTTCFMAGIFAVNQLQYDDHVMLVSLPLARQLFDYDDYTVTAVELKIHGSVKQAQRTIRDLLGNNYQVLNRYEQQQDFFRILRIEKWLTALLMVFILLIASFNIIGALTMLMLDKQNDIRVLRDLGADAKLIRRIFMTEGWLISALGAAAGLALGVGICLLQEHFGWIKLGNGTQYVLSAYPVHVQPTDLLLVAATVPLWGLLIWKICAKHITST